MSWQRIVLSISMAAIAAGLAPRPALADFDVQPVNVGGKIYTGGVDDGTGEVHDFQRVFTYAFQEEPDDPFNIGDPGFNAVAGSGLQAVAMQFDILGPAQGSRLPYNLSYWDGTGDVEWTIVPNGEALKLILGRNRGRPLRAPACLPASRCKPWKPTAACTSTSARRCWGATETRCRPTTAVGATATASRRRRGFMRWPCSFATAL